LYRAIDEHGQIVDAFFGEQRTAAAAWAFFEGALRETGLYPERVMTDKAACYPGVIRTVLPEAEHHQSKYLNNGIECTHGPFKQRVRPMRSFKCTAAATVFVRGHALIENLRHGFSRLTEPLSPPLRLLQGWPQLAQVLSERII
jgi:transposase-like protein